MNSISRVSIRDIRCFAGEHEASLPRVTLLVGENSTGKSTLLACCLALSSMVISPRTRYAPFGRKPFGWQNFASIARDTCPSFGVGGRVGGLSYSFTLERGKDGYPTERSATVDMGESKALQVDNLPDRGVWRLKGPNFAFDLAVDQLSYFEISQWLGFSVRQGQLPFGGSPEHYATVSERSGFARMHNFLAALSELSRHQGRLVRALSPTDRVEGGLYERHPLFPMRNTDDESTAELMERVRGAGNSLGLFSDLRVRRRGRWNVLEVKVRGRFRDVANVGLGVQFALPILAKFSEDPSGTFLVQQPETHLHPSAEAALAQVMAASSSQFVVETHSDFILRRMQNCVRNGVLDPGDVGILWFETWRNRTRIHEISLGEGGDPVNAPPNYRKFFTHETFRFLGLRKE